VSPNFEKLDLTLKQDVLSRLKFNDQGLIPAIVVDRESKDVLMMAWMDRQAIIKTVNTGRTCFYSRSRKTYWQKGETSGNRQWVKQILSDCDDDTLLIIVDQEGAGACHTGSRTCFFNVLSDAT
jgi:phosphoribosyl-AMP cyclohydrolase